MPRPRSDWTARRTRVRPHHCWSESGGPGAITCSTAPFCQGNSEGFTFENHVPCAAEMVRTYLVGSVLEAPHAASDCGF